jgi:hypothetical protein
MRGRSISPPPQAYDNYVVDLREPASNTTEFHSTKRSRTGDDCCSMFTWSGRWYLQFSNNYDTGLLQDIERSNQRVLVTLTMGINGIYPSPIVFVGDEVEHNPTSVTLRLLGDRQQIPDFEMYNFNLLKFLYVPEQLNSVFPDMAKPNDVWPLNPITSPPYRTHPLSVTLEGHISEASMGLFCNRNGVKQLIIPANRTLSEYCLMTIPVRSRDGISTHYWTALYTTDNVWSSTDEGDKVVQIFGLDQPPPSLFRTSLVRAQIVESQ